MSNIYQRLVETAIICLNYTSHSEIYRTVTGEGDTSISFPDSVELFSGGRVKENSQRWYMLKL